MFGFFGRFREVFKDLELIRINRRWYDLRKVVFTVLVVVIAASIVSMAAGAKNSEEKVVREPLFYNELAKLGTDEILELAKKNKTI